MITIEEYKQDKNMLIEMIKQNDSTLMKISEELWDEEEFALAAISVSNSALKFINKKFWEDYEFIKKALSVNCNSIDFLTDKIYFLHEDEFHKIWLNTKKRNYDAICQKDESFIDNIVPVLDVLSETGNGKLLGNVSERLRNDEKIVCAALQSSIIPIDLKHWDYDYDLETLEYIGNDLWCNSQFVLKVLKMFAPVEYEILERFNEKIPKDVRALYFKD